MLFLFDDGRDALGSLEGSARYLVFDGDELENSIETLFEEVEVHILRAADEEEINLHPMAFLEPFRGFFRFELEVVIAGAYFDLNILQIRGLGL